MKEERGRKKRRKEGRNGGKKIRRKEERKEGKKERTAEPAERKVGQSITRRLLQLRIECGEIVSPLSKLRQG